MELSAPFTRWFDADGCFVAKPFQQWLATEVPVIGDADPKNKQERNAANGRVQVAEAVVIQQSETPKKTLSREASTPATTTRSRRGKK